jgi:glyoxylase-like metal-dependent hydrolase (beta-lactamase superfamily II)
VNNVYLVVDGARKTLVDAGTRYRVAEEDLARAARVLKKFFDQDLDGIGDVIVTHAHIDHYGAVGMWRAKGARVHAHELDARVVSNFEERIVVASVKLRQWLAGAGVAEDERRELAAMYVAGKNAYRSVPVDRVLLDGAVVCGAVAHHVPGHCPGQICLQFDDVLLTADHVLSRITPHQSPEEITQSAGLDHYFESLEKIRRVGGIHLALPGHEEPILRLGERIAEIDAFHRGRLEKVREICRAAPRTIKQIAGELFGGQPGYGRILAYQETGAHVEYLARRGHLEIANLDDFGASENPVILYKAA